MPIYSLAIDIGASSGRHILGHVEDGRMVLEEVYRFDNRQVWRGGHCCWDIEQLWAEIQKGLQACKAAGKIPQTVAIDTWAVDYVLLDENGTPIGNAVAYRDSRTDGMDRILDRIITPQALYAVTGIQKQPFNTIYQLLALQKEHPQDLERARRLLMIPDYFHYRLTGVPLQEYTNATTTGLVDARTKDWDDDLIRKLQLPRRLFGPLSMPGTVVGHFLPQVAAEAGFDATVILPTTHDTGSAFLAVPAQDNRSVYLSSGTWSLMGTEREAPVTTEASRLLNFTNEGGAWYRYRYLKNIMGLWMIQSVRRELNGVAYVAGREAVAATGRQYTFPDLIAQARSAEGFPSLVDVDDPSFLAPDSMIRAVREACGKTGQAVPQTVGEIMQCIYNSLANRYAQVVDELREMTGTDYTRIHMVGGGCRDDYLNQLTASATGLTVCAGPVEGTALGNLMVQWIHSGAFDSLDDARAAIRHSFPIKSANKKSSRF